MPSKLRAMVFSRSAALALGSCIALGCSVEASTGSGTDGETDTDTVDPTQSDDSSGESTGPGPGTTTTDPTTDDTSSADDTTGNATQGGTDSGGDHTDCDFTEDFEGIADGEAWPAPWEIDGGVAVADVQGGRGRLQAAISDYSLARISIPLDCQNVDASVTFEFTDGGTQGAALYARTNGGYLRQTNPTGEGYAAFSELFRDPSAIGVWREVDGQEQLIGSQGTPLQPNTPYRMRFRLTQADAGTSVLQAKVWPASGSEPGEWMIERTDDTASLQGVGGGIALDAWSSGPIGNGNGADLFFDDLVVSQAQ